MFPKNEALPQQINGALDDNTIFHRFNKSYARTYFIYRSMKRLYAKSCCNRWLQKRALHCAVTCAHYSALWHTSLESEPFVQLPNVLYGPDSYQDALHAVTALPATSISYISPPLLIYLKLSSARILKSQSSRQNGPQALYSKRRKFATR